MKPGITAKLFLAIVLTCAIAVLVMGVAERVSFRHGLLEFLNRVEAERLELLSTALVEEYAEQGGWEHLRGERRKWRLLVTRAMRAPREHFDGDRPPGRAPLALLETLARRLTLLDAARVPVAGNPHPPADARLARLEVDSRIVGWLALAPARTVHDTMALAFQARQRSFALWIGLAVLVLAVVAALILSRHLLAPVRRLAAGTRALTAGSFDTRIEVTGSDELGALARDFNLLASTLERNEQARRNFMADISHELRTPLAVLKGEIEALEDGVRALTPQALRSLATEVGTLGKLIEDLYQLSLSDIGVARYQKVTCDLRALLADSIDTFAATLAERSLELEFDPGPDVALTMLADAARLRQLFSNLIGNSARYTDAGGRILVSVRREGDAARIRIEDSAPGVPEEALPRLFDRLYRVDSSRSRAGGGAGLGLSICRSVVEAHDGTIEAGHSPLGGLAVTVKLPLEAGAGAAAGNRQ